MAPPIFGGPAPRTPQLAKSVWVEISPPGVSPPCFAIYDLLVTGYWWSNISHPKQACIAAYCSSLTSSDHECMRLHAFNETASLIDKLWVTSIKASIGRFHSIIHYKQMNLKGSNCLVTLIITDKAASKLSK